MLNMQQEHEYNYISNKKDVTTVAYGFACLLHQVSMIFATTVPTFTLLLYTMQFLRISLSVLQLRRRADTGHLQQCNHMYTIANINMMQGREAAFC